MKKIKFIALTALAALMICLCVLCTGCYGSVEGTYKFKKATVDGEKIKVGDSYELGFGGLSKEYTADDIVATISSDDDGNTLYTCISILFAEASGVGSWEEDGSGKIKVTLGDYSATYKCNGKTLVIKVGDNTYTLEKVEEEE